LKWINNESEAVFLIDGFKTPVKPQSVDWTVAVLIGLGIGVLIGMLLTLLLEIKRSIRNS
jgi:hypothetical protein